MLGGLLTCRREESNDERPIRPIDPQVFWPSLICVLAVILPLAALPEASDALLKRILSFTTHQLGFLYLWFVAANFAVLLWLAFGRYGRVLLGSSDERPEFSTLSWIAMLFCAGIGTSLLYWATIEWVYYYQAPPFGVEAESVEAAHWAATRRAGRGCRSDRCSVWPYRIRSLGARVVWAGVYTPSGRLRSLAVRYAARCRRSKSEKRLKSRSKVTRRQSPVNANAAR